MTLPPRRNPVKVTANLSQKLLERKFAIMLQNALPVAAVLGQGEIASSRVHFFSDFVGGGKVDEMKILKEIFSSMKLWKEIKQIQLEVWKKLIKKMKTNRQRN